jgi:uncharacterized protein YpmS
MNLSLRTRMLGSVVVALSLAVLACGSPLGIGQPTAPASPIPVSTEAAGELEDLWANAIQNAGPNGEVTVVMTEEQLTSYVAVKLAEEPDVPLENIQVFLRDGQMTLTGDAKVGVLKAKASLAIDVTVDDKGELKVEITDADFGPVPVPSDMLESLNESLQESLTNELTINSTEVTIQSVAIADGKMSFSGIIKK